MRIIAGSLKGRRLETPGWEGLRPTSDRLRETLFNILSGRLAGAHVLDGYAGTGAVGIEALSRGAERVVFVERDARALRLIAENLAHCGVADGYAIIRADITRLSHPGGGRPFDLVLLDPPYADPDLEACLARAAGWLAGRRHAGARARAPPGVPPAAGGLVRARVVHSGDSALSFYRCGSADASTAGSIAPSSS